MSVPAATLAAARSALKEVEADAAEFAMYSTEYRGAETLPSVGTRRRTLRRGEADPVSTVSLVINEEGVLLWREDAPSAQLAGRRQRRGVAPPPEGELVELYQYEKLEPNQINRLLTALDLRLNQSLAAEAGAGAAEQKFRRPWSALWRLAPGGAAAKIIAAEGKKRRLLLVHGTFSKSEAFLHGIGKAPNGDAFLKRIFRHYDEVLAFEHPTLSVSPVLNAYDLAGFMAKASGPLDVVAHSRGGLVTRWFLEGFAAGAAHDPCRAVLVGAPLSGTSLASPPRLRDSLSMLSNIGTALKLAGAASVVYFPFLAAPLALLKVATSVVGVAARTPVIDAAVSMIPGLSAQSRVGMNHELDRVRAFAPAKPPVYFVVCANFETEDPGWRFWKWFRGERLKDIGADKVFPGRNDLVVDTESMSEFSPAGEPLPAARLHDFETTATVHHTNYFEQKETLEFILDRLGVP